MAQSRSSLTDGMMALSANKRGRGVILGPVVVALAFPFATTPGRAPATNSSAEPPRTRTRTVLLSGEGRLTERHPSQFRPHRPRAGADTG